MTKSKAYDKNSDKPARKAGAPGAGKRRLMAGTALVVCVVAGGFLLLDRKTLPPKVRNNTYVESLYHARDAALSTSGAALSTGTAAALDHGAAVLEHGAEALEHHAAAETHATDAHAGEPASVTPAAGDAAPAARKPQVGYPEGDREKLDKLIDNGGAAK